MAEIKYQDFRSPDEAATMIMQHNLINDYTMFQVVSFGKEFLRPDEYPCLVAIWRPKPTNE